MRRTLMIVLPVLLVVVGAVGALALYWNRAEAETTTPQVRAPLVRVQTVQHEDRQLTVHSQGTVNPRTESTLVPEVAGRVIEVSPSFAAGGFFETGEVLLRVDPHDYRQAVVQAGARVAQAKMRLAQEEAEAELASREWQDLGEGEPTPLTLHKPQLAEAEASLQAARANVQQAERNLDRTGIKAPYAGRVRQKNVDVGQYITPGTPLATIYAVDYAEVRLPLPDEDLAYLDLPLDYRGEDDRQAGPQVVLSAEFAGQVHQWEGRIVRTEGEIDPRSRMVHTVARVKDPYGRGQDRSRPPLAAGLFVNAEIAGHALEGVTVLPRSALRGEDQVLVVDDDSRLRFRTVEVLRRTQQEVIIVAGLAEGEQVCLSPLVAVTDGMLVRVGEDDG